MDPCPLDGIEHATVLMIVSSPVPGGAYIDLTGQVTVVIVKMAAVLPFCAILRHFRKGELSRNLSRDLPALPGRRSPPVE